MAYTNLKIVLIPSNTISGLVHRACRFHEADNRAGGGRRVGDGNLVGQITGDTPSIRQRVSGKCQRDGCVGRDVAQGRNGERRLGCFRRQRPCVADEGPARNRKTVIGASYQTAACRRDGDGGTCTRGKLPVNSRDNACCSVAFGNAGEERLDKGDTVLTGGGGEGGVD